MNRGTHSKNRVSCYEFIFHFLPAVLHVFAVRHYLQSDAVTDIIELVNNTYEH